MVARHDPRHMTEDEVAEKWADYIDMQVDVNGRLGLSERDIDPVPRDEMIELGMVFMGNVPVIETTFDNSSNQE